MKRDEWKSCLLCGGEKRLAERIERGVGVKRDHLTNLLKKGVNVARAPTLTSQLVPGVHILVWSLEGDTRVMRTASSQDPSATMADTGIAAHLRFNGIIVIEFCS